nr:C13 family peptidase [Candidatus Sigynarchaeota archaeon]
QLTNTDDAHLTDPHLSGYTTDLGIDYVRLDDEQQGNYWRGNAPSVFLVSRSCSLNANYKGNDDSNKVRIVYKVSWRWEFFWITQGYKWSTYNWNQYGEEYDTITRNIIPISCDYSSSFQDAYAIIISGGNHDDAGRFVVTCDYAFQNLTRNGFSRYQTKYLIANGEEYRSNYRSIHPSENYITVADSYEDLTSAFSTQFKYGDIPDADDLVAVFLRNHGQNITGRFCIDYNNDNDTTGLNEKIYPLQFANDMISQLSYKVLIIIVDSCYSGHFIDDNVLQAYNPIIITSTSSTVNGWSSNRTGFGIYFWNQFSQGKTIDEAFKGAFAKINETYPDQQPQIYRSILGELVAMTMRKIGVFPEAHVTRTSIGVGFSSTVDLYVYNNNLDARKVVITGLFDNRGSGLPNKLYLGADGHYEDPCEAWTINGKNTIKIRVSCGGSIFDLYLI